jgi:hypothetical protein
MKSMLLILFCCQFFACEGETSNPATASKSDLAPPGNLRAITHSTKIELRFQSANTEDDFRGFYVFSRDAATALPSVSFPTTGIDTSLTGVPRCKKNNDFFVAFGLPTAEEISCPDDAEEAAPAAAETMGSSLKQDAAEKLTGWKKCDEEKGTDVSLTAKAPSTGEITCTVSGLTDGTTYQFVVFSVMGEDLKKVSWSSNVAEDTPATLALDATLELEHGEYHTITLAPDAATPSASVGAAASACGSANPICQLSSNNGTATSAPTIYIGRQPDNTASTTDYPQRLFISASSAAASPNVVIIQPRGPQIDLGGVDVMGLPGGMAAATYPSAAGGKFAVYDHQVFDFQVDGKYYGKVVVYDVTLATATDPTSKASLKVKVVMQPTASVRHYVR